MRAMATRRRYRPFQRDVACRGAGAKLACMERSYDFRLRPMDVLAGGVHLWAAYTLIRLNWSGSLYLGLVEAAAGVVLLARYRRAFWLGAPSAIVGLLGGAACLLVAPGIKTSSGQPYSGGLFAILGLIAIVWGLSGVHMLRRAGSQTKSATFRAAERDNEEEPS